MHILAPTSHPWPKLRFGSLRIWDDGVTWNVLQPSGPGAWDQAALARLDAIVNTALSHHVKPTLVLGQTPSWASTEPSQPGSYGPGAAAPPKSLSYWTQYVSFLAKRYRGRIEAYEVWNEPCFANQWSGTVAQLVQLTSAARRAIKAADPQALVMSPSVPVENHQAPPYLRAYLPRVAGQVDVVGVHLYPAPHHSPESVAPLVAETKAIMTSAGISAPIWNTEENLGSRYSHDAYTGKRAAALTARALLLESELGVQRTYWYAADDHTWGAVFLLASDNVTLTPAGVAQGVVAGWLVGAHPLGCTRPSSSAWSCGFTLSNGRRATAVWTTAHTTTTKVPAGAVVRRIDGGSAPASGSVAVTTTPQLIVG